MPVHWIEAGGEYQLLFMAAASRSLKGDREIQCPKCQSNILRTYHHVFDKKTEKGTIWVWCSSCKISAHLPRVRPEQLKFPDPFSELDTAEFSRVEEDATESLLDRLDRFWERGEIGYPEKTKID